MVSIDEDEVVQPWDAMVGSFSLSPRFMLGTRHGGEWLNIDLTHPFYGWVECAGPIPNFNFAPSV